MMHVVLNVVLVAAMLQAPVARDTTKVRGPVRAALGATLAQQPRPHRTVAIVSMSAALLSYAIMLPIFREE